MSLAKKTLYTANTNDDYENYDDYIDIYLDIRWDLMEEDFNKNF